VDEKLNLTLDRDKREKGINTRLIYFLLIVTVLLGGLSLALFFTGGGSPADGKNNLPAGRLEELALKLERQNLLQPAARVWTEYLTVSDAGEKERATIWYRIGKIYQKDNDYERALEAYYHSESFAEIDNFKSDLSRRTTECLERLGMFAALHDELREKTSISQDNDEGKEIVAEIGNWKITKPEMESLIEDEIDVMLSSVASDLTGEQRREQKEKMLKNALDGKNRMQWFQNYIAEELIYRDAMEKKLYENPDYKKLARRTERKMLVQRFLEDEYNSKISIKEEDLRAYYEVHKEEFKDEEGGQKSFDDSKQQVYSKVRAGKEVEVQQGLMQKLMNQYDVVIHNPNTGKSE
jgi:tetratricopeptide (TPR) repeat protein